MTEFKLYDFQQTAVDEAISELAFGSNNIAIDAPTSAGKSAIIAGLCHDLETESVVILVTITELIDQIAEHLDHMKLDYSILKAGRDSEFDPTKRIQLCMAQTLYARIDKVDIKCDIAVFDEYHISYETKRTSTILDKLQPTGRIGLSATPYDANGFKLDGAEIVNTKSVQALQDEGKLSPIKYFIPKWSQKVDYSKVKMNGSEYNMTSLDKVVTTGKHISKCIESMNLMDGQNKKTIVFCSSVEHCEAVTLALVTAGYKAEQVHSKQPAIDNDNIIYAFKHGTKYVAGVKRIENTDGKTLFKQEDIHAGSDVNCLVSVMKLSTGFSVKDIQLGVMMASTTVRSKYIQQIGRLCRTHPDKTHGELLDLGLNFAKFGFHTSEFNPLTKTDCDATNRKLKFESEEAQEVKHLSDSLTDDLEEFDESKYKVRIEALEKKDEELRQKANDITNWSMKELAKAYDYTDDINIVISIGAEIYTRKFGDPISKAGRPYKFDPSWITADFQSVFDKYPEKKRNWVRAYKTRARNIIKQGKNFNQLKFFINFLVEKHEDHIGYTTQYENIAEDDAPKQNKSYAPEIIIDEGDMPF